MIRKIAKAIISAFLVFTFILCACSCAAEPKSEISIVKITFIEGWGVNKIIDTFVENGIGTREGFLDAVENGDFSEYWFINELDEYLEANPESGRFYRLEGYLFPDTYYFYGSLTEEQCLDKMLANFEKKFGDDLRQKCEETGMSCDEAVNLASIIQREGLYSKDYPLISSVFHNRLENEDAETRGFLQSNATGNYDESYSTYLNKGLPPGPICCPSYDAIYYALNPADTDYYYFVSDSEGNFYYSETYAEHHEKVVSIG